MLYPYPIEIPTADVAALVMDALRNRQVDAKEAAHATWHVIGYGLSKWDAHPLMGSVASVTTTEVSEAEAEECAKRLEALCGPEGCQQADGGDETGESGGPRAACAGAEVVPWELVVPVLIRLFIKLLSKQ